MKGWILIFKPLNTVGFLNTLLRKVAAAYKNNLYLTTLSASIRTHKHGKPNTCTTYNVSIWSCTSLCLNHWKKSAQCVKHLWTTKYRSAPLCRNQHPTGTKSQKRSRKGFSGLCFDAFTEWITVYTTVLTVEQSDWAVSPVQSLTGHCLHHDPL